MVPDVSDRNMTDVWVRTGLGLAFTEVMIHPRRVEHFAQWQ